MRATLPAGCASADQGIASEAPMAPTSDRRDTLMSSLFAFEAIELYQSCMHRERMRNNPTPMAAVKARR
jgi:hypothetical protein